MIVSDSDGRIGGSNGKADILEAGKCFSDDDIGCGREIVFFGKMGENEVFRAFFCERRGKFGAIGIGKMSMIGKNTAF